MTSLPFDPSDPPAQPPLGCRDAERWHDSYRLFHDHRPKAGGRCEGCREVWPCIEHKLAVRGLLDICAAGCAVDGGSLPRITGVTLCRWCERAIELGAWGWMHRWDALFLCKAPKAGSPPLCSAEPAGQGPPA